MKNSLFKKYVKNLYDVVLTDIEEDRLVDYLAEHVEDFHDTYEVRKYIFNFVKTLYDISNSLSHANDNSDLEQMLKIVKAKAKKK